MYCFVVYNVFPFHSLIEFGFYCPIVFLQNVCVCVSILYCYLHFVLQIIQINKGDELHTKPNWMFKAKGIHVNARVNYWREVLPKKNSCLLYTPIYYFHLPTNIFHFFSQNGSILSLHRGKKFKSRKLLNATMVK